MGTVPYGALLLAGGIDIQKDRIEVSIWGFGREKRSWLIEHRVLEGDTARDDVWLRLGLMLQESWTHISGVPMRLVRMGLDTGYATQEAYTFVRRQHDPRLLPMKGVARGAALVGLPTAVDMTTHGKRLRRGLRVYAVVGGIAKLEFFNNLRKTIEVTEDGEIVFPNGYVHLPQVDAEYVQQLCSEQLVTRRDRNGFSFREWQKVRERNEALDCYVYARAAASLAGLDRFEERHWLELERQLGIPLSAEPPELRMDGLFPVRPGFETPEFLQGIQGVRPPNDDVDFVEAEPKVEMHDEADDPPEDVSWRSPTVLPNPPSVQNLPATPSGGFFMNKVPQRGRRVIRSNWMK
jgi:phage terminase large subunit GpA-like protein